MFQIHRICTWNSVYYIHAAMTVSSCSTHDFLCKHPVGAGLGWMPMVNDSGWTTIMHSSVPLVAVLQPLVPLPQERPCRKLKKRRQRRGSEALRTCLKRLQHSRNNHERMQENKTETNRARGEAGPKRVERHAELHQLHLQLLHIRTTHQCIHFLHHKRMKITSDIFHL